MSQPRTVADGRFRLEEPIGKGGVGEVWRASGSAGGRQFALKLLRPEYAQNPQLRRRFAREARAASRLSHPNLVTIYAFGGGADEQLYIAMELAEGPSLAHAIRKGLSLRNILEVADRLLAGLAHAHARGVIHRDLKPDNILLAGASLPAEIGVPKIVDFGIASVPFDGPRGEDRETHQNEVVGTPRYMSPEQAMGDRNLGPQSDIYNVGLMMYELVTGSPPFGSQHGLAVMSRHVHEAIPQIVPREKLKVPDELITIIDKALEKRIGDRWSSAAQMRLALRPLLEAAQNDEEANQQPEPILAAPDGFADQSKITTPNFRPDLVAATAEHDASELGLEFGPWNYRVPFVGRDNERAFLRATAARAAGEEKGAIVLVEGQAGVGKTRLCRWIREELEEQGMFRSAAGGFLRGSRGGLRGIKDVLNTIFRTEGLDRAKLRTRIAERFEEWGHDGADDAAALTDFLMPASADDTRPNATPQAALFALLARTLELTATRTPRLVILDDIQWAGGELIELLEHLAARMRHRPVKLLVLATIRSEDLGDNPEVANSLDALTRYEGDSVLRLGVDRLETIAGRALIAKLLPCEDELAELILERTGGNPLHLLMLLRYLHEEALLEATDSGVYRAADHADIANVVPPNLGELFEMRISQAQTNHDAGTRFFTLLRLAAVLGFRFQFEVLRQLVDAHGDANVEAHFDLDLDRLLAEGFIVEPDGRDDWYAFSHGLLRDYLLRAMSEGELMRLHELAARSWERALGDGSDAYAFEIARHWDACSKRDEALQWYKRAAETARRSFVLRQAMLAYEEALAILDARLGIVAGPRQPLGQNKTIEDFEAAGVDPAEYLQVLSHIGDLHEGFGEFKTSEFAYRRVVRLIARDSSNPRYAAPLGWSWLGLGHIAWQRGDFEAAEWAFRKVRELVRPYEEATKLDGEAARGLARVAWHRGDYVLAAGLAEEARELAEQLDHASGRAEATWLLGEIDRMMGRGETAKKRYAESIREYRSIQHPSGIARNLLSLAQIARYQKDFASARDLYANALAHYENLGDRRGEGQCHNGLGDIARFEQRHKDADREYARALEIWESIGAEYDIAVALANLGLNSIAVADYESAEGYLEAALNIIGAGDYPYLQAGVEYNLALVHALRGSADSDEIRSIVELADRIPIADLDYAEPLEQLAELRSQQGKPDEAVALWEKARQIYDELGLDEDRDRVDRCINGDFG